MGNASFRETKLLDAGLDSVAAVLPSSWRLEQRSREGKGPESKRADAVVELIGPSGGRATFLVETKRSGAVPVQLQLTALREQARCTNMPMLFISDYIGPTLREALSEAGVSFADATGWVRVVCDDPLILLTADGADRSPHSQRRTNSVTRLNGIAAGRTIRALVTTEPPVGVRQLAGLAEVSPGSVSKLLATLVAEGALERDRHGVVLLIRRRALIQRWVKDYSFTESNQGITYCIAPRGLERTQDRLVNMTEVALTGSAAARRLLPEATTSVVPLRLLALYAADPTSLVADLGLIEAEPSTANVVITQPQDPDILQPDTVGDWPAIAPVGLVLADLLTLPGRGDAEAEQLLDALTISDEAWRQ